MAFLLMLGIQARIILWTITNNIGVDAKRDFFLFKVKVRSKVKEVPLCRKMTFNIVNYFFHHKMVPI